MARALPFTTQLYVDGAWGDYDAYGEQGMTISVGPDDETGTQPSQIDLRWQNHTGAMDPENVAGPLWGKIGRNTPARVQYDGTTLATGQASMWDPDASEDHQPGTQNVPRIDGAGDAWVDFRAMGLLGQLARWEDPIGSAIVRNVTSYTGLLGLWPLEGGNSDSTRLSEVSGVPGAQPGTIAGTVTFGGNDGPGGGDSCVELGDGGTLAGRFADSGVDGWQFVFHTELPAVPASSTYGTLARLRLSNGNTIVWQINDTTYRILVSASDGTTLLSGVTGRGSIDVSKWVRHRLKATVSGGTVTMEYAWYDQDASVITGNSGTYSAGSTGRLVSWDINQMGYSNGAGVYGVFATSDTTIDITGDFDSFASFNGYLGETTADRFTRMMGEQGLSAFVYGTSTTRMGRQRPKVFGDHLAEIQATEDGLIFDDPADVTVTLRTRSQILGQSVQIALTKSQCVAPLKRLTDDVPVVNQVTVENYDGAQAVAVLTEGRNSIQLPPDGVGVYPKKVDVCQQNSGSALDDRASWELAKASIDRPRYKTITIDLVGQPSLIPYVVELRPGDLITLDGAVPDTVRLHVLKLVHTCTTAGWRVVLTCRPADAWAPGIYDDTGSRRDAYASKTTGTTSSSATTLAVATTVAGTIDTWSTTAVPYDIETAGERMTVTAASAPVAGAQNLTVTRSVNGVVKSHVAGQRVGLADPRRKVY